MVGVLDLEAKRHKFSSTLSGGQKRKLSVGIAVLLFFESYSVKNSFLLIVDSQVGTGYPS
jgi:ABC-type lipoprotein export system ATPase subunit